MSDKRTKDWQLYEAGRSYNNKLEPSYYTTVDTNLAFVEGNQWRGLEGEEIPKPTFNIIKRVLQFFVASLTSSKIKIHFEPLLYSEASQNDEEITPADIANAQVQNLLEKFKFDFKIKDVLFDGASTGDGCAHFFFNVNKKPYGGAVKDVKGEIEMELVDGTNVFFGNANSSLVSNQPYIILSGRDMVDNLKEEAKLYKQKNQEIDSIKSDSDYEDQAGDSGKIEVDADDYGKALYIIVYRKDKKTGRILASKSVENAYIYKDIDTGLSHYPIAWFNWEKQKNQYHGRALCTGIIPNQIYINRMFAMVMYNSMLTAFPKAVFNADVIPNWNNQIGEAIPVRGLEANENIKNIAGYLEPGNMSSQINNIIELAMQYTKETLGISDAALGQIDPKNTSAIIAVQKSSAIPLENPKANLYEWIETIGEILFDMMGAKYGVRPIQIERNGQKEIVEFDFSQFKDTWLDIRADVGESTYWSELASIQTLDNLLAQDKIDFLDYLERVPEEYIPQKQELMSKIKENMAAQQQQANDPSALIAQLSPEEQQAFNNAPPEVQQQILAQVQQPSTPQM